MLRRWKTSSNESDIKEIVENERRSKRKMKNTINDEIEEQMECGRNQRKAGTVK